MVTMSGVKTSCGGGSGGRIRIMNCGSGGEIRRGKYSHSIQDSHETMIKSE